MPRRLALSYLALWLLEGALRKWVIPGLQNPLYFIRVLPVALAVVFAVSRLRRPWPLGAHLGVVYVMGIVVFTAFHVEKGDQTLVQAVLGCRLWLEAVLMPLALGPLLRRADVESVAKAILVLVFPISVLATTQVLSPPNAPINKLLAADGGDNFMNEGGVVRASGLFTSSVGHVTFVVLAMAAAMAMTTAAKVSRSTRRLALAALPVILFMAATSGSRSAVFGCLIVAVLGLLLPLFNRRSTGTVTAILQVVGGSALAFWIASRAAPEVMSAIAQRFSGDGLVAEPQQRMAGSLVDWVHLLPWSASTGQGLGTTAMGLRNRGAGATAEVELSQWVLQLGAPLFVVLTAVRFGLWAYLLVRVMGARVVGAGAAAYFLVAGMFVGLNGSVTGQVSVNGFTVLAVLLVMGATAAGEGTVTAHEGGSSSIWVPISAGAENMTQQAVMVTSGSGRG